MKCTMKMKLTGASATDRSTRQGVVGPCCVLPAFAVAVLSTCIVGSASAVDAVFHVDDTQSTLSVGASATVEVFGIPITVSDSDEQSLGGTINATFDFPAAEFPPTLGFEITGADIQHLAPYQLNLGNGAVLVTVTDGLVDVTTPAPPATLTRVVDPGVLYEFDAAEFEIAIVEGIAAVSGPIVNDSIDFSEMPAAGSPDVGIHIGEISFVATPLDGGGASVDAVLRLPISFEEDVDFDDNLVTLGLDGEVVARSTFEIGIPEESADFDGNGVVDQDDLTLWEQQFGDSMHGGQFLLWQQQYQGAAQIGGVPEPGALGLSALAVVGACLRRRYRCLGKIRFR